MTLVFAIIAIVCICFGICQVSGGYAVGSGFAAILVGTGLVLQECVGVIDVVSIV